MDIVLKGVKIIDPSSPFHQQTTDIFIQNGGIAEIGTTDRKTDKELSIPGLHISPGFTDIFANFCDPGCEHSETLNSGSHAAAYGGYTDVFVIPNTTPPIHHKSGVEYIVQKSYSLPVNLHPVAAITKNTEGKELAEMYDMHVSGAVAFSDGLCPIQSSGLELKALQYLKAIDKTIIQVPDDQSISSHGLMNEGITSTHLGLPGKPAIAEEMMIARDIELAKYTGGKIHFTGISTGKGVEMIKKAKKEGIEITCSVTPYHLFFTEEDLRDYDTNLKVSPPLRTKDDRNSLRNALLDGTIDCIASHHLPQHYDHKVLEFEYAKNGMIGLETCFAAVRTAVPELSIEQLVHLFSLSPRNIFGLKPPSIALHEKTAFSLFLPDEEWTPKAFFSKSKNSAFGGKKLRGRPVGIIHKDNLFLRP